MRIPHFDIGPDDPELQCIVCGMGVAKRDGMVRMEVEDRVVCLCSTLCAETYGKHPDVYHALRDCRAANRGMRRIVAQ
mgnify:CR=1 FL=1